MRLRQLRCCVPGSMNRSWSDMSTSALASSTPVRDQQLPCITVITEACPHSCIEGLLWPFIGGDCNAVRACTCDMQTSHGIATCCRASSVSWGRLQQAHELTGLLPPAMAHGKSSRAGPVTWTWIWHAVSERKPQPLRAQGWGNASPQQAAPNAGEKVQVHGVHLQGCTEEAPLALLPCLPSFWLPV